MVVRLVFRVELRRDFRGGGVMIDLSKKQRDADKIDEILDYTLDCNQMLVADLRKLVRYLVELCGECVDMSADCVFTDQVARLAEFKEIALKLGALK